MKFFSDTRTKRHTVSVVLFVWLFAFASSVANACFLETDRPHAGLAKKSVGTTIQTPSGSHAHPGTVDVHHDDPNGTKESCLKVCDDGTHTLPKALSDAHHCDPGLPPLVATLWSEAPKVASTARRLDALAIPIVGPPLSVRYSRLAL